MNIKKLFLAFILSCIQLPIYSMDEDANKKDSWSSKYPKLAKASIYGSKVLPYVIAIGAAYLIYSKVDQLNENKNRENKLREEQNAILESQAGSMQTSNFLGLINTGIRLFK